MISCSTCWGATARGFPANSAAAVTPWLPWLTTSRDFRIVSRRLRGRSANLTRSDCSRALSSDWSALVQVQNVLGHQYDGVFDFRLGDAPVLSRLVSGGLAVRF